MGKMKYLMAAAIVTMAATSCTDLDVDVMSKLTQYPTESEIALEGKMADAY